MAKKSNEDQLDEHLDRLAYTIQGGYVIPIIGNNVLTFNHPKDKGQLPLSDLLAVKIAEKLGKHTEGINTIDQLYHSYTVPGELYYDLKEQLNIEFTPKNISFELFDLLAQIKSFKLLFNASYTDFLEDHLCQYQHNSPLSSRSLYLNRDNQSEDLDMNEEGEGLVEYNGLKGTHIYNLFGHYNSNSTYIVTEDDYIEFIFRLKNSNLPTLRNVLKDPNISFLFIGCTFPNWLFRFFIRALLDVPKLHNIKSRKFYVSESSLTKKDPIMVFFKNYEITYLSGLSSAEFIRKLYQKLQEKYPNEIDSKLMNCMVFISYASEDSTKVKKIRNQLRNEEKIPSWTDIDNIGPGNDIQGKLKEAIDNSSVFIPIISKASNIGNNDRHYRKEWRYALMKQQAGELTIIPIKIDNLKSDSLGIPQAIRELRRGEYLNSKIQPDTIDEIRRIQKNCQRKK